MEKHEAGDHSEASKKAGQGLKIHAAHQHEVPPTDEQEHLLHALA